MQKIGLTWLSVITIFFAGFTVLNYRWNESWKLFWYDLKSGFSDTGYLYILCIGLLFLIITWGGVWYMAYITVSM